MICDTWTQHWSPNCQQDRGHAGPCDGRRSNLYVPPTDEIMTRDEYRKSVSSCTVCHDRYIGKSHNVFPSPRFGLGQRTNPDLMVVDSAPPKGQAMHGAFMLHYGQEYDTHTRNEDALMYKLVTESLQLRVSDVYGVCAVKCPVHFDAPPDRNLIHRCSRFHLMQELQDVKPRIILCAGQSAQDAVGNVLCIPQIGDKHWSVTPLPSYPYSPLHSIRTYANVIEIPHPTDVLRRASKEKGGQQVIEEWIDTTARVYRTLKGRCYP